MAHMSQLSKKADCCIALARWGHEETQIEFENKNNATVLLITQVKVKKYAHLSTSLWFLELFGFENVQHNQWLLIENSTV